MNSCSITMSLSNDTQIVRFMSLTKLQSIIAGKLWLPSLHVLSELNDPGEGDLDGCLNMFPDLRHVRDDLMEYAENHDDIRSLFGKNPGHREQVMAWCHYIRRHRAASCWFKGPYESYPMWETYGKYGVAIETTVGKLKSAIGFNETDFCVGRVFYYSSGMRDLPISTDHLKTGRVCPSFLKPKAFEAEREIRLICQIPEGARGRELKLESRFPDWVERVVVYPYPDYREFERAKQVIAKLVGKQFSSYRIVESEIRKRSHLFADLERKARDLAASNSATERSRPRCSLDAVSLGRWPTTRNDEN